MLSALFCLSAKATTSQSALHQQAQQKALQEKLVPATPDVRLAPGKTPENTSLTGKDTPSDEQMAVRLLGHAIIGGVVAELNGAPAAGGAVGAVSGEVAAITISKLYFGKPPSELNESEREQLSGMSTIAAALAGSLASDSATGTIAGAQAGKNAVENNYLSWDEAQAFDKEMTACRKSGGGLWRYPE